MTKPFRIGHGADSATQDFVRWAKSKAEALDTVMGSDDFSWTKRIDLPGGGHVDFRGGDALTCNLHVPPGAVAYAQLPEEEAPEIPEEESYATPEAEVPEHETPEISITRAPEVETPEEREQEIERRRLLLELQETTIPKSGPYIALNYWDHHPFTSSAWEDYHPAGYVMFPVPTQGTGFTQEIFNNAVIVPEFGHEMSTGHAKAYYEPGGAGEPYPHPLRPSLFLHTPFSEDVLSPAFGIDRNLEQFYWSFPHHLKRYTYLLVHGLAPGAVTGGYSSLDYEMTERASMRPFYVVDVGETMQSLTHSQQSVRDWMDNTWTIPFRTPPQEARDGFRYIDYHHWLYPDEFEPLGILYFHGLSVQMSVSTYNMQRSLLPGAGTHRVDVGFVRILYYAQHRRPDGSWPIEFDKYNYTVPHGVRSIFFFYEHGTAQAAWLEGPMGFWDEGGNQMTTFDEVSNINWNVGGDTPAWTSTGGENTHQIDMKSEKDGVTITERSARYDNV